MGIFLAEEVTVTEKNFPVLLLRANDFEQNLENYRRDIDVDDVVHIDVAKMMLEGTDRNLEDEIGSKLFYLMNDVIRYANIKKLQSYQILDEALTPKKTLVVIDSLNNMINFGKAYNCFIEIVVRDVIDILPIDLLKECQTIIATPSLHKEVYHSFFDDKEFLDTILETQDSHLENIVSHFEKGSFLVNRKE